MLPFTSDLLGGEGDKLVRISCCCKCSEDCHVPAQ